MAGDLIWEAQMLLQVVFDRNTSAESCGWAVFFDPYLATITFKAGRGTSAGTFRKHRVQCCVTKSFRGTKVYKVIWPHLNIKTGWRHCIINQFCRISLTVLVGQYSPHFIFLRMKPNWQIPWNQEKHETLWSDVCLRGRAFSCQFQTNIDSIQASCAFGPMPSTIARSRQEKTSFRHAFPDRFRSFQMYECSICKRGIPKFRIASDK